MKFVQGGWGAVGLVLLLASGCGAPVPSASVPSQPAPRAAQSSPSTPSQPAPRAAPPPPVQPVTAADRQQSAEVIEAAIRETLDKPDGPLTVVDRLRVTELYLIDRGIADLAALAALPRLKVLNLRGNRIANLQPLAGLAHLQKLGLDGNQVSDLSPLLGLRQLKVVDLYGNPRLPPGQVTRLRQVLPGCRVLVGDP